jgi:hypothetical protein
VTWKATRVIYGPDPVAEKLSYDQKTRIVIADSNATIQGERQTLSAIASKSQTTCAKASSRA